MVQAVRYLRDYEIVHLDLKPNNVMIFWNMLVKLIDFGESYHPKVCLTGNSICIKAIVLVLLFPTVLLRYSVTKLTVLQVKVMYFHWV